MVTFANLQKNDVNLAFVNDNAYTKFAVLTSIKGRNSVANLPKNRLYTIPMKILLIMIMHIQIW